MARQTIDHAFAWTSLGTATGAHERCEDAVLDLVRAVYWTGPTDAPVGGYMADVLIIALTIVVFGFLWLLVKGVERFER
jgi:hypothetical protein